MKQWKAIKLNKGSAAVEASLVIPVFLFAMVYVYLMLQCILAEQVVYEAAAETAEYLAEISYLGDGTVAAAYMKFPDYVDETETVERYIKGGCNGIHFLGSESLDENQMVVLSVSYQTKYAGERSYVIKKRAYVGNDNDKTEETEEEAADEYVYVTENQSVYHMTRRCSYLMLAIQPATMQQAKNKGYEACEFCGAQCDEAVYITEQGMKYHSSNLCSGLKRTVYRKKKSEVGNLNPCSRCGMQ